MNQKQIGVIVLIIGFILAGFVFAAKAREDKHIQDYVDNTGTCYLGDGTCLHEDRDLTLFIVGWVMSAALVILGTYLIAFDKVQQLVVQQNVQVAKALKEAKKTDSFKAYLAGFSQDEQKILKAVHDQDGIKQATLTYRLGMSKAALSMALKDLEQRDVVSRKAAGKTYEVYLRKKF